MDSILTQVLIIIGLIIANGFLAMAEIAIVSARKVRLQQRAEEGDAKAKIALELANSPAGSSPPSRSASPWWGSWPVPSAG